MKTGQVLSYDVERGRGAIRGDDGQDVFLHRKSFREGAVPAPGDRVRYEVEEHDGMMIAAKVERL
jgi:cold shock CspA family protein